MSPRTFLVGLLAFVCGVSASVGVNRLRHAGKVAKPETVVVPVAAVAIKRGDVVTEKMLAGRHWPKDLVPAGAILKKDEIVGKIAKVSLAKDEPIYSGKIGDTPSFAGMVKPGMRACAILTPNDSTFVAGLIQPEDNVDVLFTDSTDSELTGGTSTALMLHKIKVLAIGHIIDPDESRESDNKRMRSVTLEVSPEQANQLVLAQKAGTLNLALRSESDDATPDVPNATQAALFGTPAPPPPVEPVKVEPIEEEEPAPKIPSQFAVRTLRGSMRSTMRMRIGDGQGSVYVEGK